MNGYSLRNAPRWKQIFSAGISTERPYRVDRRLAPNVPDRQERSTSAPARRNAEAATDEAGLGLLYKTTDDGAALGALVPGVVAACEQPGDSRGFANRAGPMRATILIGTHGRATHGRGLETRRGASVAVPGTPAIRCLTTRRTAGRRRFALTLGRGSIKRGESSDPGDPNNGLCHTLANPRERRVCSARRREAPGGLAARSFQSNRGRFSFCAPVKACRNGKDPANLPPLTRAVARNGAAGLPGSTANASQVRPATLDSVVETPLMGGGLVELRTPGTPGLRGPTTTATRRYVGSQCSYDMFVMSPPDRQEHGSSVRRP